MDRQLKQSSSLEEALSNLQLSSTVNPNSLYHPTGVQEPILNPSAPRSFHQWSTNNGGAAANPSWVQDASYAPLPPPPSPTTMWLPPAIHHLPPPALLNPLYSTTATQQNIWGPPDRYMAPSADLSLWSADSQRRFDATANFQDSIRNISREKIEIVFQAVLERIDEMMTHPTSNYIVQRLIEVADDHQKHDLVSLLARRRYLLRKLCSDTHGTRVVQKLVDNLQISYQRDFLLSSLRSDVLPLALNDNGRHVIIRCLRNFSDAENGPILTEIARNCFAMGRHKSGYLVLTEYLSCNNWGSNGALVLGRIAQNALLFSHDQYGNYVVQHALEQQIPQLTTSILTRLKGNYIDLSTSKYGSNVVEKCLNISSRDQVESIIHELLHSEISKLVSHPYGNYVMQTCLTMSKNQGLEFQHRELLALLRIHVAELKISNYGKQLMKWISSSSR